MSARSQQCHRLTFRGAEWPKGLCPGEMQPVADPWRAWFRRLADHGEAVDG